MTRRRVIFQGRVQGVCFRATAAELASRFAVTGYVRNCTDGTVELEAQGTLLEIDRFIGAIRDEFRTFVTGTEITDATAVDNDQDFQIRY